MAEELIATASDGSRLAISVHEGPLGAPLLLMIPGLGATRRVYAPLLPALVSSLRVALFDPRGTGGTTAPPGPWTMETLADDAATVLDAVGAAGACVFGASMGGMVAQHVALRHRERVDRLVLACTGPGGSHAVRADPQATRLLLGKGARSPEEAYRLACEVLYEAGFRRDHPDFVEAQIAERRDHPVPASSFQWQYEAVRHHDTWERLGTLTTPTLVVHGLEDLVMPVDNGRAIAERIPGARGEWLDGRGHLFFHEDPDTSAALITRFCVDGRR